MLEFSLSSESKYSWSPFSIPVPKITKLVIPKNQGFIKKMWNRAWKLTEHDIRSGLKPEKVMHISLFVVDHFQFTTI
jgi:hypothetical protein